MRWEVVQTERMRAWYQSLDEVLQDDVGLAVDVLEQIGPTLGRPWVDTVKGSRYANMKELRVESKGRPLRIFFAFDPKRQAVLLLGGDKTGDGRFYERLLPLADREFAAYLARLDEEK